MIDAVTTFLRERAPDPAPVTILQPADPFLETVGEDLRRRIFITESADGALKCLRPEFTIPICLNHIENDLVAGRYAYGGTVFRQSREGASEFSQAGLEDLGNDNVVDADVQCLNDMLEALRLCGEPECRITLGDQQLFAVVVTSLGLPPTLAERLVRSFGAPGVLANQINNLAAGNADLPSGRGLQELIDKADEPALIDKIYSMMEKAGLPPKSGRSPQDIARRMIEKAAETNFKLAPQQVLMLQEFLAIRSPLDTAEDELVIFANNHGVDLGDALETFSSRLKELRAQDCIAENVTFSAAFGRKLDYYTGLLFEAHRKGEEKALAGGGRYDRLCTLLGSKNPIPAVGFSISLDRLTEGANT